MDQHDEKSKNAFDALDAILNESPDLLEIEILPSALCPPGQPPIIRDGKCIGISKKFLVLAYTHAVRRMFHASGASSDSSVPSHNAFRASTVVLLVAPEHITAANIRKRHIASSSHTSEALGAVLAAELRFLDSIFTSPLPRHTKSPTLWSHRRWLFESFAPPVLYAAACESRSVDLYSVLDSELQVIQRATDHHPRNYYAFDFLRKLVLYLLPLHAPESRGIFEHPGLVSIQAARHAAPVIHTFCRTHPSDTSAWSALVFLLTTAEDEQMTCAILIETLDFVRKFRWKGEAIWSFVRVVMAGGVNLNEQSRTRLRNELVSWMTPDKQGDIGELCERAQKHQVTIMNNQSETASALMLEAARNTVEWIDKRWMYGSQSTWTNSRVL